MKRVLTSYNLFLPRHLADDSITSKIKTLRTGWVILFDNEHFHD